MRALSTIIEDGEGQGGEGQGHSGGQSGEDDDESQYVHLDDVRTSMIGLSSPTAVPNEGPRGVAPSALVTGSVDDDDEVGPTAPPRSTSLRQRAGRVQGTRSLVQGEGEGSVASEGEVSSDGRENVATPVSKEDIGTLDNIGTLEDDGTPMSREDVRTPVNRDDIGTPVSREDVRTPVNAEDLGTQENTGTPDKSESPGTAVDRNIGSPEHVGTPVRNSESVETPVRSKIRTPEGVGSPLSSKEAPLTVEGDEVPSSDPPGDGDPPGSHGAEAMAGGGVAGAEHGLALIISPPPEDETTPSADSSNSSSNTMPTSNSDITSNLDTASPADSTASNFDTSTNPTAASNIGATGSPRSSDLDGVAAATTSPSASNLDIAAASTTSPTASNLDITVASRTSPRSCPIQTDLDRRERMAAVASAAAARLASNLEKSPVRRTSSSNNSPVLRSKSPHTPTMSRRPSSEMLVLQPLSPEHGADLNDRYEFLRRTLSHSQRRYSQRGRKQRDRQPGAKVPNVGVANEGATGGGVANGVIAGGSAAHVPRSGLGRTLSSRDHRQKQTIGHLRDIVRGNEPQAPPTSQPIDNAGDTEAHVDQHGRTYYMDHSTRTIAFDRRAGPQASPQHEVQTRREMLDRR